MEDKERRITMALFHDPIEKAIFMMDPIALAPKEGELKQLRDKYKDRYKSHELYSIDRYYREIFDGKNLEDIMKEFEKWGLDRADHIASSVDRLPEIIKKDVSSLLFVSPLSGDKLVLIDDKINTNTGEKEKNRESIRTAFDEAEKMKIVFPSKDEKGFLYKLYWLVGLPRKVHRILSKDVYASQYILPAETRIPNHSIIDHLFLSAAVAALSEDKKERVCATLLVINIRGVQEFIRNSVKLKDLWSSSMLYSLLMVRILKRIMDRYSPFNVIYPSLVANPVFYKTILEDMIDEDEKKVYIPIWLKVGGQVTDDKSKNKKEIDAELKDLAVIPTIPNKAVVLVKNEDLDEIIDEIRREVENVWNEWIDDSLSLVKGIDRQWVEKQKKLKPLVEFGWAPLNVGGKLSDWDKYLSPTERNKWRKYILNKDNIYQDIYVATRNVEYFLASEIMDGRLTLRKSVDLRSIYEGIDDIRVKERSYSGSGYEAIGQIDGEFVDLQLIVKRRIAQEYDYWIPSVSEISISSFVLSELKVNRNKHEYGKWNSIGEILERVLDEDNKYEQYKKQWSKYWKENVKWHVRGKHPFAKVLFFLAGSQLLYNDEFIDSVKSKIDKKLGELFDEVVKQAKGYNKVAFVQLDGDKMGDWVGGKHENIPSILEQVHPDIHEQIRQITQNIDDVRILLGAAYHSFLSRSLSMYSLLVLGVVQKYGGFLVYAGGDDVLAVFPADIAVDAANDLQRLYRGEYSGEIGIQVGDKILAFELLDNQYGEKSSFVVYKSMDESIIIGNVPGRRMTMSGGVLVTHFKHPMRLSLEMVYNLMKEAKKKGRDRVAVAVVQRSGLEIRTFLRWNEVDKAKEWAERIERGIGGLSNRKFYMIMPYRDRENTWRWRDAALDAIMDAEVGDVESAKMFIKNILLHGDKDCEEVSKLVDYLFEGLNEKNLRKELPNRIMGVRVFMEIGGDDIVAG